MKVLFKSLFATAAIFSIVAFSGCAHDHCDDSKCKTEKCCGKDGKCCKKK